MQQKVEKNINLMKWISLYFSLLLFIAIVIRLLVNELQFPLLMLGSIVCISLAAFHFFANRNISYNILASIFISIMIVGIFLGTFFAGGINSPVIIILPILVVFAFILFERKLSWVTVGLITFLIIAYVVLQISDFTFPENTLSENQASIMRGVWLIFNILIMALSISFFKKENEELRKKLFEESITDHLTGLPNRRFIEQFINFELAREKHEGRKISLLMIDIDFFKKYNDYYGHIEGDKCLVKVANFLKEHFKRRTDFIGRFGGEEFIVVISGLKDDEVYELAESYRSKLEAMAIPHAYSEFGKITVSIGINTIDGNTNMEMNDLIDSADKALYSSKSKGRNRISLANVAK